MRALLLVLVLAGLAHAEEIAEADVLRVQLAESRAAELSARIELAKHDLAELTKAVEAERAALRKKYSLTDGDQIDAKRTIVRAPKPKEPKK